MSFDNRKICLVEADKRHDIPTMAECLHMLRNQFHVSADILRHSRKVAEVALALGSALRSSGGWTWK